MLDAQAAREKSRAAADDANSNQFKQLVEMCSQFGNHNKALETRHNKALDKIQHLDSDFTRTMHERDLATQAALTSMFPVKTATSSKGPAGPSGPGGGDDPPAGNPNGQTPEHNVFFPYRTAGAGSLARRGV